MILRELEAGDEEAFLRLLDEWDFLFGLLDELGFEKYLLMLQELKVSDTPTIALFGFVKGEIVGKVSIRQYPNPAGNLGYAVAEKYQRRGHGSELIQLAFGAARSMGMESLTLVTKESNTPSLKLILKNGGTLISTSEKNLEYRIVLKT